MFILHNIATFVLSFTPACCHVLPLGDQSDWRKCDSLARILVTCPQQSTSASDYYAQVCPQVCCSSTTALQTQMHSSEVQGTSTLSQEAYAQCKQVTTVI